jgi:hypothetical protein
VRGMSHTIFIRTFAGVIGAIELANAAAANTRAATRLLRDSTGRRWG